MKGKYIIISLLVALLVITVIKMMQYEKSIREEKIIRVFVDDDSGPLLSKLPSEKLQNKALASEYNFMAVGNYFRSLITDKYINKDKYYWEDIYLKGVNIGAAMPGKFPAEFSLSFDEYLQWFVLIGEMNANVIRTYTILPPEFYTALTFYNLHHMDKVLYLMQGVWAKIPPDENYYDEEYTRNFQKEIINVIDVIHGKAVLEKERGKASGIYASDVSPYIAGILLGREWEPVAVHHTNLINNNNQYNGDFICVNDGNPMEAWLAEMMDFAISYETQQYQWQHPMSFVNWLPLDPMYHHTEIIENSKVREYDNDLESIDFRKFNTTALFAPGIFASYHAYPYYPDYIYLQESYNREKNITGASDPFLGYLRELKEHLPGIPLVIAEYGIPSSRGNSHVTPTGFDQGGHSEAEQAGLSLVLTQDIFDAQCAGAIYFEWIDEWFKHNWLVMDFEQPFHHRKLWHNMENPEQNFGVFAIESRTKTMDGKTDDWQDITAAGDEIKLSAGADPAYFYLASVLPEFNFEKNNLYIALDIYDKDKGDHRLPFTEKEFENGFEYLLEFRSKDEAEILVDEPFSVFTDIYNDHVPVYASKQNHNGEYTHQLLLTNRSRETLLGDRVDSIMVNRGLLVHGNSSLPGHSNSDWYFNDSSFTFELRLDWHLINVSDPSHIYVLDDIEGTPEIEFSETTGFELFLFVTDKEDRIIYQYPESSPFSYVWEGWEIPEYKSRLKPVYDTLQQYFAEVKPALQHDPENIIEESIQITDFYNNKRGAISLVFDNAGYSQYQLALPVLQKYHLKGSFGIIPDFLDESPGLYEYDEGVRLKRLSLKELRAISEEGNEITFQPENAQAFNPDAFTLLRNNTPLTSMHLHGNNNFELPLPSSIIFKRSDCKTNQMLNTYSGIRYSLVNTGIDQKQLYNLLENNIDQWTILVYHHFYEDSLQFRNITGDISEKYFLEKSDFEKQVRLVRNMDFWIAPESAVFKYLKEKQVSVIEINRYQNYIFFKVINQLDRDVYDQPLSIEFKTGARLIKVTGSLNDGTYTNRANGILFNVVPGKEITMEIIE